MGRDLTSVAKSAITDTCSVWNTLSSETLSRACQSAGFVFCLTEFVLYECLYKPRKTSKAADSELMERLRRARSAGQYQQVKLSVEDLQDVERFELRKKVSMGELSAIAFAHRTGAPFQTDDQGARKLAHAVLPQERVQTTPHVVGWMFFHGQLVDHDLSRIIDEHTSFERPLSRFFRDMYEEAMRCRLMSR